jgi:hypothetical protein
MTVGRTTTYFPQLTSLVSQKVQKTNKITAQNCLGGSNRTSGHIFSNLEVEITSDDRVHLQGLALGQVPLH